MKSDNPASGFRSADEWKSALMTLPDSNFLELMRSIFGNIKTPFNKQRLLDDLFVLLSREEIRKTIAAYLDEDDHRLIAAIALLKEPLPGELESFFTGEITYADLHALLVNLEERLILYRLGEGAERRLALNPVLEPVLAPLVADREPLFPAFAAENSSEKKQKPSKASRSRRGGEGVRSAYIQDGRILASLFAFVSGEEGIFKTEGGLRKKILDEGKRFFPGLDLELTIGALCQLGLFKDDGAASERLLIDDDRIEDFSALSARERNEYWAAGVFLYLHGDESFLDGLPRGRVRTAAAFIHRFCLLLESSAKRGVLYPRITLRRFAEFLGREDSGGGTLWGYKIREVKIKLPFDALLDTLAKTGLLVGEEGDCWKMGPLLIPPNAGEPADGSGQPVIVMDTAFSFVLYPEISFADAFALARFCSVRQDTEQKETGAAVCFELTRSSAVRGFDRGISSQAMLELLGRLSGNRLEGSLAWTLKDWESRYAAVSLHQGTVLTLTEDRRYLAEAAPVKALIKRTLAPGVYLLASGERTEAASALKKAGVDIIAQPPSLSAEVNERPARHSGVFFSSLKEYSAGGESHEAFLLAGQQAEKAGRKAIDASGADAVKEKFRKVLGRMKFSKSERDELSARIDRRLVLSEAQLEGASVKYEKLEARGLDYVGKAAIAKQAIASGSLLEVSWPGPEGEINRTTGIPSALEKKDGESVLILKSTPDRLQGAGESGEKEIRLLLGKISLMRRIKQSIFET